MLRLLRGSSLAATPRLVRPAVGVLRPLLCRRALTDAVATSHAAAPAVAEPSPAAASPTRFAVIAEAGTQYKVAVDDVIALEKLNIDVGKRHELRRVLLVGEASATVIGSPLIAGACVHATVEQQTIAKKVIVFKKRKRKGYKRWRGFRARLTILRINSIELPAALEQSLTEAAEAAAATEWSQG